MIILIQTFTLASIFSMLAVISYLCKNLINLKFQIEEIVQISEEWAFVRIVLHILIFQVIPASERDPKNLCL